VGLLHEITLCLFVISFFLETESLLFGKSAAIYCASRTGSGPSRSSFTGPSVSSLGLPMSRQSFVCFEGNRGFFFILYLCINYMVNESKTTIRFTFEKIQVKKLGDNERTWSIA
jgi:hypothetical protein